MTSSRPPRYSPFGMAACMAGIVYVWTNAQNGQTDWGLVAGWFFIILGLTLAVDFFVYQFVEFSAAFSQWVTPPESVYEAEPVEDMAPIRLTEPRQPPRPLDRTPDVVALRGRVAVFLDACIRNIGATSTTVPRWNAVGYSARERTELCRALRPAVVVLPNDKTLVRGVTVQTVDGPFEVTDLGSLLHAVHRGMALRAGG